MWVREIAAFTAGDSGGNPAGVAIAASLPDAAAMQWVAAEVGLSETVFAAPHLGAWRVRYFSPETEIPFCGHATLALASALGEAHGFGEFKLLLNHAKINVAARQRASVVEASLHSPPTRSAPAAATLVQGVLSLFDYEPSDLDARMPPALAHAGANHLIMPLSTRAALAAMHYDLGRGRQLMREHDLVTIAFVYADTGQLFHVRNAFASGGVYEDPATGAAAAALAGYLRDISWPHHGALDVLQGADMGVPSQIRVEVSDVRGSAVRVSGTTRLLAAPRAHPL